jgi:uncharacterized protein (TIGR03067 family)
MLGMVLVLAGVTAGGDAAKADVQRLQGSWIAVTERPGGVKQTDLLTFKGGQLGWMLVGQTPNHWLGHEFKMTYTLDPSRTPKRITLRTDDELLKGTPLDAVYAFEGDTLLLAFIKPGKGPPKDFKGKPDDDGPFTFKRHKPAPKP